MFIGTATSQRRTGPRASISTALPSLLFWANARLTWLSLIGATALTLALYGRALEFAFFFDDTFDLARTEGRSYWSLLASSEGYSYYRPVPFLIWKLLRQLQGQYHEPTLHVLPLFAHAVAGWLLFLLLRRLGIGAWALMPMALFLSYPFDYQSVAIVGTLFHPLAGAAILGSLLLYLMAREETNARRRGLLHVSALACTVVALWSHESGIVVAPLVVGLEAIVLMRTGTRRPSPWVFAHVGAALLFIITWFAVEKTPFAEETNLGELRPKALYLLQALNYPFSAQIIWLEDQIGWAPGVLQTGILAIVAGLGAYAFSGWRTGDRWRGVVRRLIAPVLAVALAVVAFAPALARLSYSYLEDSPRLLYLVGIGAAIFWGLLPSLDFRHEHATRIWRIATTALLLGVVFQSWRFIDVRMEMFSRGTAVIDQIVFVGERYRGQRILVVNAPAWFAQERYEYPYGHFGVQLMPNYIGLDRVIYTSSSYSAFTEAASASWNADVSGGLYPFGLHGATASPEQLDALLRDGREVVEVRPSGDAFVVRDVGRLEPAGADVRPNLPATIAGSVSVSTARVSMATNYLDVLFAWHVIAPPREDANAVVEIRDADGEVVATYIGYPLSGYSAPRLWQTGDRIDDSVRFPLPAQGDYTIWLGMRSVSTDEPLGAVTTDDMPAPNGMVQVGAFSVP